MVMGAQLCECTKAIEPHALNGWILWYVNHIAVTLLPTPSMALQRPLEGDQAHDLPHILMRLSCLTHRRTALAHNSQEAAKPQRDTAMNSYKEAPSYKDPLCHTIPTQTHSNARSHGHPHPSSLARHSMTAGQGPSHSSGTHIHTHYSLTPYSHTQTPESKVCSHSIHTMVTHTSTLRLPGPAHPAHTGHPQTPQGSPLPPGHCTGGHSTQGPPAGSSPQEVGEVFLVTVNLPPNFPPPRGTSNWFN